MRASITRLECAAWPGARTSGRQRAGLAGPLRSLVAPPGPRLPRGLPWCFLRGADPAVRGRWFLGPLIGTGAPSGAHSRAGGHGPGPGRDGHSWEPGIHAFGDSTRIYLAPTTVPGTAWRLATKQGASSICQDSPSQTSRFLPFYWTTAQATNTYISSIQRTTDGDNMMGKNCGRKVMGVAVVLQRAVRGSLRYLGKEIHRSPQRQQQVQRPRGLSVSAVLEK